MIIDCPNCPAQYDVPDAKVRPNLRLRCSRCSTEWVANPPMAAVAPPPIEPPDFADDGFAVLPSRETNVPSFLVPGARLAPQRAVVERVVPEPAAMMSAVARDPSLSMAWVISLAILLGAGWAAVHWRAPIMQSWPPSTRAYAAIGLRPPPAPPAD